MKEPAPKSLVAVAEIVGVFGVKGEVKVTSSIPSVLAPRTPVFVRTGEKPPHPSRIVAARAHKRIILLKLQDVDDADAAQALRGAIIFAAREHMSELPELAYREADLIGMQVHDSALGKLGEVRAVRHYPQCDMLVVGDTPLLVPFLHAYGVRVDLDARQILTQLPDGFEELL